MVEKKCHSMILTWYLDAFASGACRIKTCVLLRSNRLISGAFKVNLLINKFIKIEQMGAQMHVMFVGIPSLLLGRHHNAVTAPVTPTRKSCTYVFRLFGVFLRFLKILKLGHDVVWKKNVVTCNYNAHKYNWLLHVRMNCKPAASASAMVNCWSSSSSTTSGFSEDFKKLSITWEESLEILTWNQKIL